MMIMMIYTKLHYCITANMDVRMRHWLLTDDNKTLMSGYKSSFRYIFKFCLSNNIHR